MSATTTQLTFLLLISASNQKLISIQHDRHRKIKIGTYIVVRSPVNYKLKFVSVYMIFVVEYS